MHADIDARQPDGKRQERAEDHQCAVSSGHPRRAACIRCRAGQVKRGLHRRFMVVPEQPRQDPVHRHRCDRVSARVRVAAFLHEEIDRVRPRPCNRCLHDHLDNRCQNARREDRQSVRHPGLRECQEQQDQRDDARRVAAVGDRFDQGIQSRRPPAVHGLLDGKVRLARGTARYKQGKPCEERVQDECDEDHREIFLIRSLCLCQFCWCVLHFYVCFLILPFAAAPHVATAARS